MFDFKMNVPEKVHAGLADSSFKFYAKSGEDDGPAELMIMDEIGENWWGDGIPATEVVGFMKQNSGRPVTVRINSFGGSVYDGFVMLNALLNHDAEVTTVVEGIAYSAASIIAMGGSKRIMHETSDLGIHRALVGAMGNANMMRSIVEWLDTLDAHQRTLFQSVTGKSESEIDGWLDGNDAGAMGTIFPASEAYELGFVTEVIPLVDRSKKREEAKTAAAATVKKNVQAKLGSHLDAVMARRRRNRLTM